MKTIRNFSLAASLAFGALALAPQASAQVTSATAITTNTTLSSAMGARDLVIQLTSSTNVVAQGFNNQVMSAVYVDREYMEIVSNTSATGTGNMWNVRRFAGTGAPGNIVSQHLSGATVWVSAPGSLGVFDQGVNDRVGSCAGVTFVSVPIIETRTGTLISCDANNKYRPYGVAAFWVPPTTCTGVPTTLTQTTTYPSIGTVLIPVMKSISNAAAGTLTVTCTFAIPTYVAAQRGAMIQDITMYLASSATGSGVVPTSMGTPTLGTITFPTAALTQTVSPNTAVAIGGTGTLTGGGVTGTSGFMTAVTTDGTFYTVKATFASAVDLSTDNRILQFALPVLQSAASVTTLFTPGFMVHYFAPLLY